jgi:hypothetical protein
MEDHPIMKPSSSLNNIKKIWVNFQSAVVVFDTGCYQNPTDLLSCQWLMDHLRAMFMFCDGPRRYSLVHAIYS